MKLLFLLSMKLKLKIPSGSFQKKNIEWCKWVTFNRHKKDVTQRSEGLACGSVSTKVRNWRLAGMILLAICTSNMASLPEHGSSSRSFGV